MPVHISKKKKKRRKKMDGKFIALDGHVGLHNVDDDGMHNI